MFCQKYPFFVATSIPGCVATNIAANVSCKNIWFQLKFRLLWVESHALNLMSSYFRSNCDKFCSSRR